MNLSASPSLHLLPENHQPAPAAPPTAPQSVRANHLKVLIVDQDARATAQLEQLCRDLLGDRLAQLATANSVEVAATRVATTAFDVVLLDPAAWRHDERLRFRALATLPTIIVSAHPELAVAAFEWGVRDFVPKPVNRARLAQALHRTVPPPSAPQADTAARFLAARRTGQIDFIALDDLLYVEGDDKYSKLVYTNGRRNFHDKALGRLEAALPDSFVRIHKSYLVRFTMVSRLLVLKGSRYFAELHNGLRLPVGRSRYRAVKSRLLWPPPNNGSA
jgi:DNA-binding LytR/AlgR family response regulator